MNTLKTIWANRDMLQTYDKFLIVSGVSVGTLNLYLGLLGYMFNLIIGVLIVGMLLVSLNTMAHRIRTRLEFYNKYGYLLEGK